VLIGNIFVVSVGLTNMFCMIKNQLFMVSVSMEYDKKNHIYGLGCLSRADLQKNNNPKLRPDPRSSAATCLVERRRLLGRGRGRWARRRCGGRARDGVHGAGLEDERCLLIGLEATAAALLEDERHPLGLGPLLLPPLQAGAAVVPCLGCCKEPR
jgi:hypothetical protein